MGKKLKKAIKIASAVVAVTAIAAGGAHHVQTTKRKNVSYRKMLNNAYTDTISYDQSSDDIPFLPYQQMGRLPYEHRRIIPYERLTYEKTSEPKYNFM